MKRKVILVSIYYNGITPELDRGDDDDPFNYYLNDVIQNAVKKENPHSDVWDVAIDETKPWLFGIGHWWSRYVYRFIRP